MDGCTDLTEEISREVFVNAEGSPLLLGDGGESGGDRSLRWEDIVSLLSYFKEKCDCDGAWKYRGGGKAETLTLEAEAKAEANARLRPSLNMIIRMWLCIWNVGEKSVGW